MWHVAPNVSMPYCWAVKPLQKIERYGLKWPFTVPELEIEFEMLRHGGRFKKRDGSFAGEGYEFHFKQAMKILWPWIVWHPWAELQVQCYVNYRIIGQLGAASTGKSFIPAACVLADYYLHPNSTTVMVSSTTRESLEMRVWGEIKKLHKSAKRLHPDLMGYLIEGRQRIVTDPKTEASEGRDFRNGLVGVACFLIDAQVDTPSGPRNIQDIRIGDKVFNATGVGIVRKTMTRICSRAVRVYLSDGRIIDCTPEHPFFTKNGWIKAIDLDTSEMVFSSYETMQIMRSTSAAWISQQKILQSDLQGSPPPKEMRRLRKGLLAVEEATSLGGENHGTFLQPRLCRDMAPSSSGTFPSHSPMSSLWNNNVQCSFPEGVLFCQVPTEAGDNAVRVVREVLRLHSGKTELSKNSILLHGLQNKGNAKGQKENRDFAHPRGIKGVEVISTFNVELSHTQRASKEERHEKLVQVGRCVSGHKTGCGDRWWDSQDSSKLQKGCLENICITGTRVDRVEILEQAGDKRYSVSEGGYRVYNLEVADHPSYSVNGVIVHNCKRGQSFQGIEEYIGIKNRHLRLLADELQFLPKVFVDGIANLNKNPDFKCVGSGNPKDTTDALGCLCEPAAHLGGWDGGIDQTPRTKTWEIRFPKGICIQLPGSDSPNSTLR